MKTFSCEGGEFDRERIFDRGEAEGRKWSSKSNSTHEHGKVSWARILYTTFYHDRHFIERLRRHMTCIEVQRNGKSSSQQHYITCHSYLIDIQDCSSTAAEEAGLYPIWTWILLLDDPAPIDIAGMWEKEWSFEDEDVVPAYEVRALFVVLLELVESWNISEICSLEWVPSSTYDSLLVTWIPPLFLVNIQYQSQQYIVDELFEMDISLTNHFSCMKLFMENERLKWPFLKQTNKNDHFSLSFCMKSE